MHCDNSKQAYIVHWLDHLHHLSPTPPNLRQLQEVSWLCFIEVDDAHPPFSFSFYDVFLWTLLNFVKVYDLSLLCLTLLSR
jgi:hypothetical protein